MHSNIEGNFQICISVPYKNLSQVAHMGWDIFEHIIESF